VAIAFRIQDAVEQDAYGVRGLSISDGVPAVWLCEEAGEAANRARGWISVEAALDPAASRHADKQMFTTFLTESATMDDAVRIASAAASAGEYEALGLAHAKVSCVAIARSLVVGTPSFETAGALERFREPFARALEGAG
jgi:hypothetical protein